MSPVRCTVRTLKGHTCFCIHFFHKSNTSTVLQFNLNTVQMTGARSIASDCLLDAAEQLSQHVEMLLIFEGGGKGSPGAQFFYLQQLV